MYLDHQNPIRSILFGDRYAFFTCQEGEEEGPSENVVTAENCQPAEQDNERQFQDPALVENKLLGFETRMRTFNVPLNLMRDVKERTSLDYSILREATIRCYGSNLPSSEGLEKIAGCYGEQLTHLRRFMNEFKDRSMDFTNLTPWTLFYMLATEIWEGDQKAALLQALREKVLHSPDMVKTRYDMRWPNLVLSQHSYRLFFDHVEYDKFTAEEKLIVFARVMPELLIDSDFICYLVENKKENLTELIPLLQYGLETVLDRIKYTQRCFRPQKNNRTHPTEKDVRVYHKLAALCWGREELVQKVREAFGEEADSLSHFNKYLAKLNILAQIEAMASLKKDGIIDNLSFYFKQYFSPHIFIYPPQPQLIPLFNHEQKLWMAEVLTSNPKWIRHFGSQDLLCIHEHLPHRAVWKAICEQLKSEQDLVVMSLFELGHLKKVLSLEEAQTGHSISEIFGVISSAIKKEIEN